VSFTGATNEAPLRFSTMRLLDLCHPSTFCFPCNFDSSWLFWLLELCHPLCAVYYSHHTLHLFKMRKAIGKLGSKLKPAGSSDLSPPEPGSRTQGTRPRSSRGQGTTAGSRKASGTYATESYTHGLFVLHPPPELSTDHHQFSVE
jgi:hypothetical protein